MAEPEIPEMPALEECIPYQFDNKKYQPEDHPLYASIVYRLGMLSTSSLTEAIQLKDDLYTLQRDYMGKRGFFIECGPRPFDADIQEVAEYINTKCPVWYKEPVVFETLEMKIGKHTYKLPNYANEFKVSWDVYQNWLEEWNSKEKPTREEFLQWFATSTCSDWCKMDRYGECYGGPWKADRDSEEYKGAWDACRNDNGEALWELVEAGYPAAFIRLTVDVGCGNRQESVPYSLFLCEWMRRKTARYKVPTLTEVDVRDIKIGPIRPSPGAVTAGYSLHGMPLLIKAGKLSDYSSAKPEKEKLWTVSLPEKTSVTDDELNKLFEKIIQWKPAANDKDDDVPELVENFDIPK